MFQHAVFGAPIRHSLSPRIHRAFARQCQIELDYQAIEAQAEDFTAALADFAARGGSGANVTMPLKNFAFALCAEVDRFAADAQAVNTLIRRSQHWHGANTDGIGLVRDLRQRQGLQLEARRMLLIGAGGAAQGVIAPLQQAGVKDILICNRSVEKAQQLATRFGVQSCALTELADVGAFDLIVHATGKGYSDAVMPDWPQSLAASGSVLVDLSYGHAARPALAWASEVEMVGLDGLGMLIEQAAEAFFLWHDVRPDTAPIWGELRGEI
jgi:shikimate dehydrogenase